LRFFPLFTGFKNLDLQCIKLERCFIRFFAKFYVLEYFLFQLYEEKVYNSVPTLKGEKVYNSLPTPRRYQFATPA
jgi:hypothetical protein